MNCSEIRSNIAAYLDGEIDGAPRRAMDAHFATCPACHEERLAQDAAWRLLDAWELPADLGGDPDAFVRTVVERAALEGRPAGRILGLPRPWAAAAAAVALALGGAWALQGERDPGTETASQNPDTVTHRDPATLDRGFEVGAESAEVPAALLRDLEVLEAFDALQDEDLELLEQLTDLSDEDLEVLGG